MNTKRTRTNLLLVAVFSLLATVSSAQENEPRNIWRARPRYQLSLGTEPGPLRAIQHHYEPGDDLTWGWRLGGMVRPVGNWIVAGSYSFHTSRGHVQFVDSSVHIPGHWEGFYPFYVWWEGPRDQLYVDQVTIDQDVHSYEACGGYTLPEKWPRRRLHLTLTALTGVRCMAVQELHTYAFNGSTPEDELHVKASAIGWTWMLRVRTDLHITKFVSVYSEMIFSQPLGEPHLTSSATWNGETRTVQGPKSSSSPFFGFGIALHL